MRTEPPTPNDPAPAPEWAVKATQEIISQFSEAQWATELVLGIIARHAPTPPNPNSILINPKLGLPTPPHDAPRPDCTCGDPTAPNVVHCTIAPCYHKPPAPPDSAALAAREILMLLYSSNLVADANKEGIAAIIARHIAPIVAERDRYKQALKEIAEGYANNEPTAAQWAAEALTATAGRGAT